ncbi:hypothetical protein BPJM79_10289 [Bacillus pumilus]
MDKFVSIGTDKKIDRLNRMTVCPLQDTMKPRVKKQEMT